MVLSVNLNCALHHDFRRACKPLLAVVQRTESESNAGSEVNQVHKKPKKRNIA